MFGSANPAVFVMLNPSTADANADDPTIRRCRGFAKAWECAGLLVINLYALRATDPTELGGPVDPVGPENDEHISAALYRAGLVVCAWGATPAPRKSFRVERILRLAQDAGRPLHALGTTKHGDPRHPLYLRRDARPERWEAHHAD